MTLAIVAENLFGSDLVKRTTNLAGRRAFPLVDHSDEIAGRCIVEFACARACVRPVACVDVGVACLPPCTLSCVAAYDEFWDGCFIRSRIDLALTPTKC